MCMISASNPLGLTGRLFGRWLTRVHVSSTEIFARREGRRQVVVYAMQLSSRSDAVMVLPLPVSRSTEPAEAALEFVDLHAYPTLFRDLDRAIPTPFMLETLARSKGGPSLSLSLPQLEVHHVGAYDASYVPTLTDFDRLDPRFRLPGRVWDALPQYADHGFAVFKLARGRRQRLHPMAFWFHTREPRGLFFPTVHVHDRIVRSHAHFDHQLYFQLPLAAPASDDEVIVRANDREAHVPACFRVADFLDLDRARALVDPSLALGRLTLRGDFDNEDYILSPAIA